MDAAAVHTTSSSRLIEFLLSLKIDGLPGAVIHDARNRLIDGLGCGLYGAMTPWGKAVVEVVYEEQSRGGATLFGNREPVAPARAALANGTATHGFELDDTAAGGAHTGAVVIPAALAIAEQEQLSGARLLLGLIAGYEATSRVGVAIGNVGWGFHKTGIAGAVGAAVASAVTLGLPHDQIMSAIGIACSSASGIKSFLQGDGGMIKRMHAGRAAESGVLASLLARRGFTAPRAALEGKFGLLEVYGGDGSKPEALEKGLGERYVVSYAKTKLYPFCYDIHTMAQALYALRVEHHIEHQAVRRVRVGVMQRSIAVHADVAPKDTMAAQYSMPFVAGVALVRDPKDPRTFVGDALDDPEVCAMARRVELYFDPEMEALYPDHHAARVEVHLQDGRTLDAKVVDAKGSPADPCTEKEIEDKFRQLASVANTQDSIAEILSLVSRIEQLSSVAPLSKALRGGALS